MPNYAQLVALERKFYAVPDLPNEPVRFGTTWTILSVIGLFFYIVPGVLIIIWRFKRYAKKYDEWKRQAADQEVEILKIMHDAQELL